MKETSVTNFGLVIAYLIPGFTALWGVGYFSETVRSWLGASAPDAPTIGGFLYGTLASIAVGLTVSTIRWAVLDSLHHATGLSPPKWDFSRLQQNIEAFNTLVEVHYRYYQFYANMLIALILPYVAMRSQGMLTHWQDLCFFIVEVLFFAGSRDALRKYYFRMEPVLRKAHGPRRGRNASHLGRDSIAGAGESVGEIKRSMPAIRA